MKIKVGVFFGGKSVEHEVSIITALQAVENIDREKYDVIPVYITKQNVMYCGEDLFDIKNFKDIDKLLSTCTKVTLCQVDNRAALIKVDKKLFESKVYDYIDIAFPIVHGTNVEDGTLQGLFKMYNLPYAESDVLSSAVGMDKYVCKCLLKENDIPVLPCKCFTIKDYNDGVEEIIKGIEESIKYPVIVKPANLGSSVGIKLAKNKEELEEAIENAFAYAKKVLVERAIVNLKEVNCSVLGDYEEAKASECEEPVKTDEILSFNDKYISGNQKGTKSSMNQGVLKLPADISKETREKIQTLAIKTFKTLGCSGVIRIDFMIDKDTDELYVNEVNTIPGSLSFHLWKATGMKYSELLDRIIELGLKKNREEAEITYSFDSNILAGYTKGGLKGLKK